VESDTYLIDDYIDSVKDDIFLVENTILSWERTSVEKDSLNHVMRIIHSLKGSSGSLGLVKVSQVCHELESLLVESKVYSFDKLLYYVDLLKDFVEKKDDFLKESKNSFNDDASHLSKIDFPYKRVLYIDDDSSFHALMRIIFKGNCSELFCCHDLKSAKELISSQAPHLIICDYYLGREVTALDLLADFKDSKTPFLILTGKNDALLQKTLSRLKKGVKVLYKPISPKTFLKSVIDTLSN